MNRRSFLKSGTIATSGVLAGCLGGGTTNLTFGEDFEHQNVRYDVKAPEAPLGGDNQAIVRVHAGESSRDSDAEGLRIEPPIQVVTIRLYFCTGESGGEPATFDPIRHNDGESVDIVIERDGERVEALPATGSGENPYGQYRYWYASDDGRGTLYDHDDWMCEESGSDVLYRGQGSEDVTVTIKHGGKKAVWSH